MKDRVESEIWNVELLPFDCLRLEPVAKPIGGLLLITVNAIVYLNQSVPAYGIATNSNMKSFTAFPLRFDVYLKLKLKL